MEKIIFYRTTGQYGFLSNLYPCEVLIDGKMFISAEHAYQYAKPNKQAIKDYIQIAPLPRLAAIVGHGLFMYDVTYDWALIKVERMRQVLESKFSNEVLRKKLLETGDAVLIEGSKTDAFWGTGKRGAGKNMLGILLMELREILRRESDGSTL